MSSPIKRSEALTPLSHDHHATLVFCLRLKNAIAANVDVETLKKYVQWFYTKNLITHFKEEEELLFRKTPHPLCERAANEHRNIEELVERFVSTGMLSTATELHQLIHNHVRFEERELFPLLEQIMKPQDLKLAGEALSANHTDVCHTEFEPAFWLK